MAVIQERIPQVKQQAPKRKGNRKLVVTLVLFFLTVLTVIFIRSPYSKIHEIKVYGNDLYTPEQILQTSGITVGTQIFNVWENNVQERLKPLEGIRQVELKRGLTGVVELHVTEHNRVAFWTSQDGSRHPLLENGMVLRQVDFSQRVVDRPLITSWGAPELLPHLAKELSKLSPAILSEISDIALTPTVYDKQRITLYMRDGNEVRTVVYKLSKMLKWYPAIVKELPKDTKGVLSLFEQPWFVPYGTPQAPIPVQTGEEKENQS